MQFLGNKKNKKELVLALDIGSYSIGGTLFLMQKNSVPEVLFSTREQIKVQKNTNFDNFLLSSLKSLETLLSKVHTCGIGAPKRIFCTLSSPWYLSQTRTISLKKNSPFVFSNKIAEKLIQKEMSLFESESENKDPHVENKMSMLEVRNMKIILNGYEISKPMNQKTQSLEMTIFISISGEEFLKKIKEKIRKFFYSENIRFSSLAMATFSVARDIFIEQDNFILVDIGGEITDISMVKKDVLSSSSSFPIGRNFLVRRIASLIDCSIEEAGSLLSLYKDDHMADSTIDKIGPIISKIREEWLKKFQESLVNLSNDILVPSVIFLTTDSDLADFFVETIKKEQFNQYTLTESKFKVIHIGNSVLDKIITFKSDVPRDPFLAIETIYINRFLH